MKSPRKKTTQPREVDPKPSQITKSYWLFAERKVGQYSEHTEHGGKWLIFVPVEKIDEVWARIKLAIEEGRLGDRAKVATARPNANAASPDKRVICVYTYRWTDEKDVRRIRQALRELGITWKIPYKADEDTYSGRYVNRGDKRISKYYE